MVTILCNTSIREIILNVFENAASWNISQMKFPWTIDFNFVFFICDNMSVSKFCLSNLYCRTSNNKGLFDGFFSKVFGTMKNSISPKKWVGFAVEVWLRVWHCWDFVYTLFYSLLSFLFSSITVNEIRMSLLYPLDLQYIFYRQY